MRQDRPRFRRVILIGTPIFTGILLLFHPLPEALLGMVAGRVWEWTVPSVELQAIRQTHLVSGTVRTGEGVRLRIVGESGPAADAHPVTPTLEDAYLYVIEQHRNGSSP